MFEKYPIEFERLSSQQARVVVYDETKKLILIAQVNPAVPKRLDEFIDSLNEKGVDVGDEDSQAAIKHRVQTEALAVLRRESREEKPQVKDYLAEMDENTVQQAREALQGPILETVLADSHTVGIAGEESLVASIYLLGTSRLLAEPMSACIQSPSSTGKSYVMNRTAEMFPSETKLIATRFSGNALFYAKPGTFKHKFVVVGEQALMPSESDMAVRQTLRELMSEGRVSKQVVVKKGDSFETIEFNAEGPIAYIDSTTKAEIFEEDKNRMLILHTDETSEQSELIIKDQAARSADPNAEQKEARPEILRHWAIQRLLQPHVIAIPYAPEIASRLTTHNVEVRRAVPLLFGCIKASALLHQHQRDVDDRGFLLATVADYTVAHMLLASWLREALSNALSRGNQQFLNWLRSTFGEQKSFTVADCVHTGKNRGHSKHQIGRLLDAGAVKLSTRSTGGAVGHTYKITGNDDAEIQLGLISPEVPRNSP